MLEPTFRLPVGTPNVEFLEAIAEVWRFPAVGRATRGTAVTAMGKVHLFT